MEGLMGRPDDTDGCRQLRLLVGTLVRAQLKELIVDVIPTEVFPSGTKPALIEKLIQYVEHNGPHGYRCVLSKFSKRQIDTLLSRGGKTKDQSMEMFRAVDQLGSVATTPAAPSDGKTPPDSYLAIVPYGAPEDSDMPLVSFSGPSCRKRLIKRWKKLWRRKVLSQKLVEQLRKVMTTEGVAEWTIKEIHIQVIKQMGVNFGTERKRNMYVYFHKKLQQMLRKMKPLRKKKNSKKKKKKNKKRPPIKVTANPDANREWRERLAMWDDDTWFLKHALLPPKKH